MSYGRNWAVIGLGFISKRHLEAIDKNGDVVLLTCDIDPKKGADFTDWQKVRASNMYRRVTHVAVCTPNDTHGDIVRDALADGKQVICEKPLVIDGDYAGLEGVNVVLQLRCNPEVAKLKRRLKGQNNQLSIKVKAYREQKYWDSWKGQPERSGGILFNMGVHYIDLLIHLLGEPQEILYKAYNPKLLATGSVRFEKGIGSYHIELTTEPCETIRDIQLNGKTANVEGATIPLSNSSNQGYLDLHTALYKVTAEGKGIQLEEAIKSLELVSKLIV